MGLTKKKSSLQNDIVTRSPAETPRTTSKVTIGKCCFENCQVTISESSDLEFKCIAGSVYIYIYTVYVYAFWWLMVFSKFLQSFTSFVGPPNLPHHETHRVQGTRVKSSTLKPGRAPSSHPKHSVLVKAQTLPPEMELVGLEG